MKRAAIYCRVSTDKQRDNYSIPSQLAECVKYAEKKGYTIVGDRYVDQQTGKDCMPGHGIRAFVDDYSSLELYRPGLDACYDYLSKQGFESVIVFSIDRLDRDPYKLRTHEYGFYKHGAGVEYVHGEYTDTPEGQFMKNVIASAAQLENDWRRERSTRGKRRKALSGKIMGYWVPYGYEVDKSTSVGLKVNHHQAKIVRLIFNYYLVDKLSIRGIAERLNGIEEYKPARGDHWGKSSVHKILNNPAYIGNLYYNKSKSLRGDDQKKIRKLRSVDEWIRIEIPSIIDESIYEETRRRLEQSSQLVRRETTRDYLLSGYIICGECGKAYVCEGRKPDPKRRTINESKQYRHRMKEGHCSNRMISTRKIDDVVWSTILNFLSNPDTIREGYQQTIDKGQQDHPREIDLLDELTRSDDKLSQRVQNLIKAYTDPDIGMDKGEFLGQKMQIDEERRQIQDRIKEIKTYLADLPTAEDLRNLEEYSAVIRDRLHGDEWEPTVENKRWVMKQLSVKVVISGEDVQITGMFGDASGLLSTPSSYYAHPQRLLQRHVLHVPVL